MTGPEFRAAKAYLGLSSAAIADAVGLEGMNRERTVRRWGVSGVRGPAAKAVRGLLESKFSADAANKS